jgi:DNA repair protein RadC
MTKPKNSEPESPGDRLAKYGADSLSIQELLAVLLFPRYKKDKAIEIAVNLLKTFNGNLINLFAATIHQLTQVKGIGFVKACQIKAVFELGNRIESYCEEMHPQIISKNDVVKLLAPHMRYLKQEEFRVLLLNSNKRLIRHERISLGSLDVALVHPREIFRPAIAAGAASLILVHNHPSGDPKPSEQDIALTKQLYMGGKIISIEVTEYIIIGLQDHVSLKDKELR